MTRWLTYIRLFDFDVKDIPGNKNGAADALSRRGFPPRDVKEDENAADEYESKLYMIGVIRSQHQLRKFGCFGNEYSGEDLQLGEYLRTLVRRCPTFNINS